MHFDPICFIVSNFLLLFSLHLHQRGEPETGSVLLSTVYFGFGALISRYPLISALNTYSLTLLSIPFSRLLYFRTLLSIK